MSYYCNGVKRDGEWAYSVQACKEEFLGNYLPGLKCFRKVPCSSHTLNCVSQKIVKKRPKNKSQ
jgi:hypothetical protein